MRGGNRWPNASRQWPLGAHELQRLEGDGKFDGAYSNLGPLNCVPDLDDVSRACARLLKPGGALVFTVIGRVCPWEIIHYARQRRWARVKVRFARNVVPVGMNKHTIWTRYYTPREFYRAFERDFTLEHYRGLCVFCAAAVSDLGAGEISARSTHGCGGSTGAWPDGRCCARSAIIS